MIAIALMIQLMKNGMCLGVKTFPYPHLTSPSLSFSFLNSSSYMKRPN